MSDPAKYRTKEELDDHKKRDALERLRKQLSDNAFTKPRVAEVDAAVEETIADAISFAEDSEEPGPEILESTTYAGAFAR